MKVTIPTFEAQPPVQPKTVYRNERDVVYQVVKEKKKKKKKSLELVPKEAPLDDPEGEIEVVVERLR